MADSSESATCVVQEDAGRTIVRRFTDQLNGETELERATIAAQEQRDEIEELAHETRLRSYYEDTSENPSALDFSAAEIARNALDGICKEMAKEMKLSRFERIGNRFGIQRKNAKAEANVIIKNSAFSDFSELKSLVEGQETQWKSTHGTVYKNFQRLCRNLDDHKQILSIFPQQSLYASVFCGSISLIIQASVHHEDIAETLSNAVSDIAIDASLCCQLLDIIRTQAMREQLSRVYAQVFRFFRDAIAWYISSKRSKFFGSFNENIRKRFDEAQKVINKAMKKMFQICSIGNAAMTKIVQRDTAASKAEILRQRQQNTTTGTDPGAFMQEFLRAMYRFQSVDDSGLGSLSLGVETRPMIEYAMSGNGAMGRSAARKSLSRLDEYIVGDEGHALFATGQLWIPDAEVDARLQSWMTSNATSHTLWIFGPASSANTSSSAKAAAMNAVLAAWRVKAPIASHFAERPRWCRDQITCEQVGILGIVYSLVMQLLQFNVDDDDFNISRADLDRLDGSEDSYAESLKVLHHLLLCTPQLRFCVVHGLNDLEWSGGADWCHELLDIIAQGQEASNGRLNILFTTSGQSRVLAERINSKDQCYAKKSARRVQLSAHDAGAASEDL
ncbi:hypothetical protein K491DRAFT_777898 [Lophiostoma macrostomum CBS 122681]|uniref:DUF7708 domain-containing protein n=1 Tax=Lophiostoma macrostomum CBS 122681 TaxID=1314788 RepID=A0A6A6T9N2_9PLEO|nr:hypothetical protein K491DRAFT_777898 [Lophiostoma macrostomum CBS 122681]